MPGPPRGRAQRDTEMERPCYEDGVIAADRVDAVSRTASPRPIADSVRHGWAMTLSARHWEPTSARASDRRPCGDSYASRSSIGKAVSRMTVAGAVWTIQPLAQTISNEVSNSSRGLSRCGRLRHVAHEQPGDSANNARVEAGDPRVGPRRPHDQRSEELIGLCAGEPRRPPRSGSDDTDRHDETDLSHIGVARSQVVHARA